jgi:hypothetical protein
MDEHKLDRIATQIWDVWSRNGTLVDPRHLESSRLMIRVIARRVYDADPDAPLFEATRRVLAIARDECKGFLKR